MEIPIDQMPPEGEWKEPAPTFSTFHPKHPTRKSRRSMALPSLPQVSENEAVPSNHTKVSLQGQGTVPIPSNTKKAEEVPGLGGPSLQAETREWFQKTQAPWFLDDGEVPVWFHGFITRREAERLLKNKPPGCYLVRFSESAVAFVLTYRSRSCYRHFLLSQKPDGRHVVLGEDSAHERLPDLLRYYTLRPLSPYGEHLTQPCIRQTPAPTGMSMQIEHSESRNEGRNGATLYSPVYKQEQVPGPVKKDNPGPREPESLFRPKPPVPTKPQIRPELYSIPAPKASHPAARPMPPHPIYQEPEEPIAFYAMGRGSKESLVNVYSEVAPMPLGHHFLRKCQSRPITVTQPLDQGTTSSFRHQPLQGHTLPANFSQQLLQDRGQEQLLLGSNKH